MAYSQSVLITGCSDGGMGAALAMAFRSAGLKVYATARNTDKMKILQSSGIETYELDVTSSKSIAACRTKISSLDILINNAGSQYTMPAADLNLDEARKVYDLNVWAHIAMVQAFLPLLQESSDPMIVNHTSISSILPVPFQCVYNSSKAAAASISDTLRLELAPLGIKVIDLRTGIVQTNLIRNRQLRGDLKLQPNSVYASARDTIEEFLTQKNYEGVGPTAQEWAEAVVKDLLNDPPLAIWRGKSADHAQQAVKPIGVFDDMLRSSGFGLVEEAIQRSGGRN